MAKHPKQTRALILAAANEIVARDGIDKLTLEAAAQAAGVSKGGLLYHFPSKEALVQGMIADYIDTFEAAIAAFLTSDEGEPARAYLRAYVRASFAADADGIEQTAGLMAAVAVNPGLLDPLRQHYADWQARLDMALPDRALATVIRLALDGLWISDLMGIAPITGERRQEALTRILALVEA